MSYSLHMLRYLYHIIVTGLMLAAVGAVGAIIMFVYYSRDLPDYKQLAAYHPNILSRFYAEDGKLLAEYAKERRIFIPINAVPRRLIYAFLAAEDKNFYDHPGVDIVSIARAMAQNIVNIGSNRRLVGGSTITQQVVKNFLLSEERTLTRKIREAILAFRISRIYSKDKILELYLNEIYLGNGSYGVAAAALNYFDKSIDELTIEDAALLAALPKAPSTYNPRKNYQKAIDRRNWVITRMEEEGFITEKESAYAQATNIALRSRAETERVRADFFAESVRQQIVKEYGEDKLYTGGLLVRTTINPALQKLVEQSLQEGLIAYDRRHGWRGPIAMTRITDNWQEQLSQFSAPSILDTWELAIVLDINNEEEQAHIGLLDGTMGVVPLREMRWARKWLPGEYLGPTVQAVSDVLSKGDIIAVEQKLAKVFSLRQIPEINGAVVVMDPHTGRVLAMMGGFNYGDSQFNRAIQAKRQPGSAFKPFVYLTALENGYTPASIIVDAEIELDQGPDLPTWKPQNYSGQYYGPSTLRKGLEKSRNVMTVRLAQNLGIEKSLEVAKRFNITQDPVRNFSMVLGATESTLLQITNAYASLVNGGKNVTPALIERIQDRNGKTIYRRDVRECIQCIIASADQMPVMQLTSPEPPVIPDTRKQLTDKRSAYQITYMLKGVVDRGTGRAARHLGKTLGGKTGTTNDSVDAWFIGFSSDLAVGVFTGFDNPRSLGEKETGASVALPIFTAIMKEALKGKPDIPFRVPEGIKLVKIDAETGLLPSPDTPKRQIIFEAFKEGTEPTSSSRVETQSEDDALPLPSVGTGIY